MEPAAFQAWLAGGATGSRWPRRARSSSSSWAAAPATARTRRAAGPACEGLFGSPVRAGRTATARHGRRDLHPRVDREPVGEGGGGLPADHADLPGPGRRGGPACSSSPTSSRCSAGAARRRPPGARRARRQPAPPRRRQPAPGGRAMSADRGRAAAAPQPANYLNVDYGVQVVAADHRPQAHRAPLPGQRHAHLLHRAAPSRWSSGWS